MKQYYKQIIANTCVANVITNFFNILFYKFSFSHQCSQDRNKAVYNRIIKSSFLSPVFSFNSESSQRKPSSTTCLPTQSFRPVIILRVKAFISITYFVANKRDKRLVAIEYCYSVVLSIYSQVKSLPSCSQLLNSLFPIRICRFQHKIPK